MFVITKIDIIMKVSAKLLTLVKFYDAPESRLPQFFPSNESSNDSLLPFLSRVKISEKMSRLSECISLFQYFVF